MSRNRPSAGIWSGVADHHPKVGRLSCAITLRIASLDLFVVRTISFKLLCLVILRHARRRLITISVTTNPTAEWIAGLVTDAFPGDEAPSHLIRDPDGVFDPAYTHVATENLVQSDGTHRCAAGTCDDCVPDLALARRALPVQVTGETRGRKHGPAPTGHGPGSQISDAGTAARTSIG